MADNNNNSFNFDSTDLVLFLYKKRWPIIIITAIAGILSIIVSLTIDEKYESTAIVFPIQYSAASSILLGQTYGTDHVLKFGEEEELERMLQVLNSVEISENIIAKHNLMEHYKIGSDTKYRWTDLYKKYYDNINFKKTKYMSIQIVVKDKDPVYAANIANDIVDLIDSAYTKIKKSQAQKALEVVKNEYEGIQKYMHVLEDSIKKIQALGITNYEAQTERYSEAYAYAITEGRTGGARELEKKMKLLAEYGENYMTLRDQLLHERSRLSLVRSKLIYAQVDAKQNLSNRFVVERAGAAEKKTYPKRTIIVVASTASGFFFALLLLVILENIKRIKKSL